jgi:LysR family glycine cleavage system transcriptional activator
MKRFMPSMSMLVAFDAVARHRSFSRAALELNLTQAAVSYRIRILEEQLGARLFLRTNRSVSLTALGRAYWGQVGAALETIENATAGLTRAGQAKERVQLRFLAMQAFSSLWLLPRLPEFQQLRPELRVNLVSWMGGSDPVGLADFAQEELDASILYLAPGRPGRGLKKELLIRDFAIPVCAPILATRTKPLRAVPDLRHHTLLHALNWPQTWQAWLSAAGAPDLQPNDEISFQNTALTIDAALQGMGVAMAHAPLVCDHLQSKRLITPFARMLPINSGYYLVYPTAGREKPGVGILREWLRAEFGRAKYYFARHYSAEFDAAAIEFSGTRPLEHKVAL